MLQVFHEQAWQGGTDRGGPLGHRSPRVLVGSEAGAVVGAEHKAVSIDVVAGMEHEAASMGGQQTRSTRRSRARICIHGQAADVEYEAKRSRSYIHGRAAGAEHEAKRSTKLHP
jgi:hypothetical protein